MQPAKSNPILQSTDKERHILQDKWPHSAFSSHFSVRQVGVSQPDARARDYSAGPSLMYRDAIGSYHIAARRSSELGIKEATWRTPPASAATLTSDTDDS